MCVCVCVCVGFSTSVLVRGWLHTAHTHSAHTTHKYSTHTLRPRPPLRSPTRLHRHHCHHYHRRAGRLVNPTHSSPPVHSPIHQLLPLLSLLPTFPNFLSIVSKPASLKTCPPHAFLPNVPLKPRSTHRNAPTSSWGASRVDTGQRAGGAPPRRKGGAEIKMLSEKDMQTQQRRAHLATINHPGVRGGITDTGEERYGYGS